MYKRVVPRDLFNESKLLKCLGQLSLLIHDGKIPGLIVKNDGNEFKINQNKNDGGLYVTSGLDFFVEIYKIQNNKFIINETRIQFYSAYNSMGNYPLLTLIGDDEEIPVLEEDGSLTNEFKLFIDKMTRPE